MKKIFISAAIILSALAGLTACGGESVPNDANTSTISDENSTVNTSNSADNTLSGNSANVFDQGESEPSDTQSADLQVGNWEDLIGADGEPITLAGATVGKEGQNTVVTFDYGFIKYAPQIYNDSIKNPDLINWETLEFAPHDTAYTPTVKRVKTGDVLENGLKVTKANEILEYGTFTDNATFETYTGWESVGGRVDFDGELTLSGALYCFPEDDYIATEGELHFFPDTTSFAELPVGCDFTASENEEYKTLEFVYPDAKLAVVGSVIYYLGNISDTDCDGIIEKGGAAEVTVTIKNIRVISNNFSHGGGRSGIFGDIVSIEEVDK